jgi:TonB family protein
MAKIPKAGHGVAAADESPHVRRVRPPHLSVEWESASDTLLSSLRALLSGPRAPRGEISTPYFQQSWVRWRIQKRALACSVAWHIVLFTFPFPVWREVKPRPVPQFQNVQITWYGVPRDLPPLRPRGRASKRSPPGDPKKPLPRRGADAFHPRQIIISAPRRPNHPRQTLIQPEAPAIPPKILPALPNIVQWAEVKQPPRPRLSISQAQLARARPKAPRRRLEDIPVPSAPNLEPQVGELNIATSELVNKKPAMPMIPTSAPRAGPQQAAQDAAPAPDLAPEIGTGNGVLPRLIALSATPAPPAPVVEVPPGNLAANVTLSPEGTQPGVPGGSPTGVAGGTGGMGGGPGSPGGTGGAAGTQAGMVAGGGGAGTGPLGISITGGNPNATSPIAGPAGSGTGAGLTPRATLRASPLPPKPEPRLRLAEPDLTRPTLAFDSIQPGAPPESILSSKRVYTLYVNMPNLSSATGSWILRFVEMNLDPAKPYTEASPAGDLVGPEPRRKVDPKYPPALISARIQGEVILYAVIRKDGSVDSIQVIKGVYPQLDQNAMEALAKWKFRPATRNGEPVELEAIVHIPFRFAPAF